MLVDPSRNCRLYQPLNNSEFLLKTNVSSRFRGARDEGEERMPYWEENITGQRRNGRSN